MRRLVILIGALTLMACQTPGQPALRSVKPKAKPSAAASARPTASRAPAAASMAPSATPGAAASSSPSGGSAGATPTPIPALELVIGEQTPDTWVAGPSLQRARAGLVAAPVKEALMVFEGDHRPSTELYAPGLAAWVLDATHDGPMNPDAQLALPLGITLPVAGTRNGAVFLAGGSLGLGPANTVLGYTDTGLFAGRVANLGVAVKAAAGGVIGNQFLVAGGMDGDGNVTGVTQAIELTNGDVAEREPMPRPVGGAASAVVGDKLYVLGGYDFEGGEITPRASVQVFDPAKNSWTTDTSAGADKPAPLPVARHSASAAVLNGKIYLVGGAGAGGGLVDVVAVYDPAARSWASGASLPTPRAMLGLAAFEDRLWAIGGVSQDGRVLPTVEVYRP